LLTVSPEGPFGSLVPFLPGEDWTCAYVHLSTLAPHFENLEKNPCASLFLSEPDQPQKNPLALKRLNLQGRAKRMDRESPEYAQVQARYLERFKSSAITFQLPDFHLWALEFSSAHLVLGFAQAFRAKAESPDEWALLRPELKGG
jgi:heme iron utilization protein